MFVSNDDAWLRIRSLLSIQYDKNDSTRYTRTIRNERSTNNTLHNQQKARAAAAAAAVAACMSCDRSIIVVLINRLVIPQYF
jgi:hypothetical protein